MTAVCRDEHTCMISMMIRVSQTHKVVRTVDTGSAWIARRSPVFDPKIGLRPKTSLRNRLRRGLYGKALKPGGYG